MNTDKSNNKREKASGNPFIKALEDKKKITAAVREGKALSSIKGIKFVKPI